ncbi:uncharacterized protein YbjT (DUF2867 family) [Thermosporothrix hazakensis]|jgi:uncharacterized protein YbjT (DUF2867 family)|uniref:Uncharacterized protein YbjT (DUF2867 family) n=1 Tax=Thermosporothrix hazakensis TaxID=644383 RepID=A0A326UBH1_THEHA|nr:NAD(P)H-binding protein [Thermosporothrix hazakensis]PZW32725.1 uncharacterized protein YbjT (DUF2867 family) [Thermosporothrix hazakensis]GCE50082.1 epimerase [Thermosporothrix hazakensis]
MSTILVTGATGKLGREVVYQLQQRQHAVRTYSRQAPSFQNVAVYQGDIRTGSSLLEATNGVDAIIHCASLRDETNATELQGIERLLEAAQGRPHIVYISIVGIDKTTYPYYQAKYRVEQVLQQSGVPYTILRTTQFHNFVLRIITEAEDPATGTITIPERMRFQTIDIADVAHALIEFAEQGPAGRAPDMGGPQILSLEEMVEIYKQIYHKQATTQYDPNGTLLSVFQSGINLVPERAVGRITWDTFLRNRA